MDIEILKKMANNESNWRERLKAVHELEKMDCQPSGDILVRLAIHDPVQPVKEAAVHAAQIRKLTHASKPVYLGKKPRGHLVKDIMKILAVVRKQFGDEVNLDDFKSKFLELYPVPYDIYEGDKGKQFDKWLSNIIPTLPRK